MCLESDFVTMDHFPFVMHRSKGLSGLTSLFKGTFEPFSYFLLLAG